MKKIISSFFLMGFFASSIFSQTKLIRGKIIGENMETLRGISIVIDDSVEVGKSDSNGFFKIEIPVTHSKISFKSVGFESTSVMLEDTCDEVEVLMILRGIYDFIPLKRADRRRQKRFDRFLRKLRQNAVEKGLFQSNNTCHDQKFIL